MNNIEKVLEKLQIIYCEKCGTFLGDNIINNIFKDALVSSIQEERARLRKVIEKNTYRGKYEGEKENGDKVMGGLTMEFILPEEILKALDSKP